MYTHTHIHLHPYYRPSVEVSTVGYALPQSPLRALGSCECMGGVTRRRPHSVTKHGRRQSYPRWLPSAAPDAIENLLCLRSVVEETLERFTGIVGAVCAVVN